MKMRRKHEVEEMVSWAENAFGEENVRWWYQAGVMIPDPNDPMRVTAHTVFTFEYEEDATAFNLRWVSDNNL